MNGTPDRRADIERAIVECVEHSDELFLGRWPNPAHELVWSLDNVDDFPCERCGRTGERGVGR